MKKPPKILIESKKTEKRAMNLENVAFKQPDKIIELIIIIEEMAFVIDIKGECNLELTFQTT